MRVHQAVWAAVGGGAVVVAAAGGLLAGKLLFDDGDTGGASAPPPSTTVAPGPVTPPEVTARSAAATLSYVAGDGKVLLEITGTRDELRSTVTGAEPDDCEAMAAELTGRYPFDTVLDRLHAMPDPFLGEWLSTYYGAAFGALDTCASDGDPAGFLGDADRAADLVDKRIAQLKEVR